MMRRVKKQIGSPIYLPLNSTTLIDTHKLLYYNTTGRGMSDMEEERFPQYKRIAIDIASQIADGRSARAKRSGRSAGFEYVYRRRR